MNRAQHHDASRLRWEWDATLSRRRWLQGIGWTLVAGTLPRKPLFAAEPISPVMAKLSTYMSEARGRALPGEAIEKAKHHILDTFAAIISGSDLPPGRAALRFVESYGGEKVATVIASRIVCGPFEAALANGVMAHADETDDSHAPSQSHPGAPIVPAALAAGERFGISGEHFLRAVVLGYDVGPRVTMSMDAIKFRNESHRSTHAIAGLFGAAAAAGCAASLTAQQMRWMLDYTAQQSSGIAAWQRDTDHIEKAFVFGGMSARSGVTAALLVQSGWTGVDDVFSGPDNFFLAYAPDANPEGLIERLGERYEVTRTDIKKWTVGSPIQPALDALEILQKRRPFEADEVERVTVRISATGARTVNNREMPDISLQHMIAVMLLDKTASFHAAHDKPRMQDPAVLRQRAKVELIPDEDLQRRLPQREAIVEVTLRDGTKLREHVPAVRGTPPNPMPREEVVGKARDLIAPVLGAANGGRLIERVLRIEDLKDIRELRPLLQRG
jgi:2-methylcitrate dehydratase PrpD